MSRSNLVWKIRDKESGLFWNGSKGCCHVIGTRFNNRSNIDSVVTMIIHKEGSFPKSWEIVRAELFETVQETRDSDWVNIDNAMTKLFADISRAHGIDGTVAYQMLELIRQERRKDELTKWPFVGLRGRNKRETWGVFVKRMAELGVPKTNFERRIRGWVMFYNETSASIARMDDLVKYVFDIESLRVEISKLLEAPLHSI